MHADDDWLGLAKASEMLCKALKPQQLQIVLSDSLVRYATFPWQEELRTAEEDLAFARLSFDDVYGANTSSEWHLAFSLARPGVSRLLVAVPKSLYSLLVTNFSQSLPPVKSIQTNFTRVLHIHRRSLPPTGWIVNLEEDSVSFGGWNDQGWTWINTVRHSGESTIDLADLLNQELTISGVGLDDKQLMAVVVNGLGMSQAELPKIDGVQWIPLAVNEPAYAPLEGIA